MFFFLILCMFEMFHNKRLSKLLSMSNFTTVYNMTHGKKRNIKLQFLPIS